MSNFLNVPTFKAPLPRNQPTGSATGNPRNKTALKPGRSLMDWVRLGSSGQDLAGTGGRRVGVTRTELAKHNKENDAWICIRGKVYNVTPYMEFHPGGIPELMRGVGTDATLLFDEVHKWVNYESMLAKCLIGPLVSGERKRTPEASANTLQASNPIILPKSVEPPKPQGKTPPRFEWFQTDNTVNLVFYPKWKQMKHEYVIIEKLKERTLRVTLQIEDHTFTSVLELGGVIEPGYSVSVSKLTGKVAIDLQKKIPGQRWLLVKEEETQPSTFIRTSGVQPSYRQCRVVSVSQVTHDTKLFCIALDKGTRMCVPIGHHVQVQETVLGMKISRNYTVVAEGLDKINPLQSQGQCFYLMIKIYPDGALTPILGLLKPNDVLHVSSLPQGTFHCGILDSVENLTLFAAGTGFTPMIRLIHHLLFCDFNTQRKITLVFFNKEIRDILWKEQLEELSSRFDSFKVHHVLSQPHSDWAGLKGRIRDELINEFVPKPSKASACYFCACGPTPFTEECVKLVKVFGYLDTMIHAFLG